MRYRIALCALVSSTASTQAFAFFGTEVAPLVQLVSGQLSEIEKLTESVGIAKDQAKLIRDLNDGVQNTVRQIQTLESIIERSQGLDPTKVASLSDLNDLLSRAKSIQSDLESLEVARLALAEGAIEQSALQGDTAYKMGQEMTTTGAGLAKESESASPGRAAQISAAADSAQMMAKGVELQTLAHLVQLQAMSLEYQKAETSKKIREERLRRSAFKKGLKR